MNQSIQGIGETLRSRASLAIIAAAFACVGALSLPGVASAQTENPASANCGGKLEFAEDAKVEGAITYRFRCNQQIRGFSVISTRSVDYFSTEVVALEDNGEASSEQASCEGPFPGSGFGCRGTINNGRTLVGEFAVTRDACTAVNKPDKLRVWVVAFTRSVDSLGRSVDAASQPFRLKRLDCSGQTPAPAGSKAVSTLITETLDALSFA